VWNGVIDRCPALVARCADAADVAAAVQFGRQHALPIAVRGGGHSVAGHATNDGGLVIDLGALKEIQVDPQARRARGAPRIAPTAGGRLTSCLQAKTTGTPRRTTRRTSPGARHDRCSAALLEWRRLSNQNILPVTGG
jgi:hypothetical protein